MRRAGLIVIAVVGWGAMIGASLVMLTPDEDAAITRAAAAELDGALRAAAANGAEAERELLAAVREAASILRVGALLERTETLAEPAKKDKKKPAKGAPATLTPEEAQDQLRTLEADLKDAVGGPGRWIAVVNRAGDVVISNGDGGWALGAQVKNHPLVQDGMLGLSRLAQYDAQLLVAAPAVAKDGGANGVLVVGRPVDLCASLGTKTTSVAIARGATILCKSDGFAATAVAPGFNVVPVAGDGVMFVDPAHIGFAVLGGERLLGDLTVAAGKDMRPDYAHLAEWQQRVIMIWLLALIPLALLMVLTWFMAVSPAQAIANHLALLTQNSRVAPLSERKFSGGFRRVVKNLNTLFERKESRPVGPSSLAPISQLLQTQPKEEISGEFKLDSINEGPTAQRQIPPEKLQALREQAKEKEPATPPPPVASPPPAAEPAKKPPLAPLTGLSALSESIFDEEKTVTSKLSPDDIAAIRGAAGGGEPRTNPGFDEKKARALFDDPPPSEPLKPEPSKPKATPMFDEPTVPRNQTPLFSEPTPPAPPLDEPPPAAATTGISKLDTLSDAETESGLGALNTFMPSAEPALAPPPPVLVPPPPPAFDSSESESEPEERTMIMRTPMEPPIPLPPPPEASTPWPESTVIAPLPAMPPPPSTDPDDAHFQEVFQQFLKVREQCGETTGNLTYDKFVEKLKKSREQVMQKQNTRSVRFQVYVKDGKAALKAVAAGRPSV